MLFPSSPLNALVNFTFCNAFAVDNISIPEISNGSYSGASTTIAYSAYG